MLKLIETEWGEAQSTTSVEKKHYVGGKINLSSSGRKRTGTLSSSLVHLHKPNLDDDNDDLSPNTGSPDKSNIL